MVLAASAVGTYLRVFLIPPPVYFPQSFLSPLFRRHNHTSDVQVLLCPKIRVLLSASCETQVKVLTELFFESTNLSS